MLIYGDTAGNIRALQVLLSKVGDLRDDLMYLQNQKDFPISENEWRLWSSRYGNSELTNLDGMLRNVQRFIKESLNTLYERRRLKQ